MRQDSFHTGQQNSHDEQGQRAIESVFGKVSSKASQAPAKKSPQAVPGMYTGVSRSGKVKRYESASPRLCNNSDVSFSPPD